MTFTHSVASNNFGCAKWIVSANVYEGTHTTIATALTSSSSGDTIFIRPGTYSENLTLKAGVNLTAYESDSSLNQTGKVIISGNATLSTAGSVTISGIQLQTNSGNILTVSGSNASIVNLNNCNLNCTNNTGISFTASNTSAAINVYRCTGDLGTTGIALYSMSSTGIMNFYYCSFSNSGVSTTASSNSAGFILFHFSIGPYAFSTSSTGSFLANNSILNIGVISNTTCVTTAGSSATNGLILCNITSGSASAVSAGSGTTIQIGNTVVDSTNTNAITGAGTVVYSEVAFQNTSSLINTTSQTRRNMSTGGISFDGGTNTLSTYTEGTFTPTMVGASTAGSTTYTAQNGYYRRIGNLVTIQGVVQGSAATGTGFVSLANFPFTVKSQTNGNVQGPIVIALSITWPASTTSAVLQAAGNVTAANIFCSGSGASGAFITIANASFNHQYTITYEI